MESYSVVKGSWKQYRLRILSIKDMLKDKEIHDLYEFNITFLKNLKLYTKCIKYLDFNQIQRALFKCVVHSDSRLPSEAALQAVPDSKREKPNLTYRFQSAGLI